MPQLIYRGYNTLVNLEKANGNISCTSVNVSTNHTLIESQGAYGGALNVGADINIGIKSPFRKDYPNISCSLSFQPTFQQYKNIIGWLEERHKPTTVIIKTGENSDNNCLRFDQCYLQRLSINVSQDSFLTMEVDLYVRDTYDSTTLKYGGKHTNEVANSNSSAIGGINDLNNKYKQFIPYYYTGIKTNQLNNKYLDNKLMSWNVSFTQNIIKKTFCCGDYDQEAPLPQYIMFGVLSIDCSIQLMVGIEKMDQSQLLFDVQFGGDQQFDQEHDIQFWVHDAKPFELLGCQLNSVTPNVGQMNQVYTASMNFSAYGLNIN